MTKSILKEIMVILLLILVIILLLGVLLYNYIPMNKVIPQEVKYVAGEDTKQALEEKKVADSESVVLTYEVSATDLQNYQKVNEYKAGRKNPFGEITEDETESGTNSNTGSSTNSGSNSTSSGSNNSGSSGNSGSSSNSNSTHYYPDKGTK